jgi:hypothetical protein
MKKLVYLKAWRENEKPVICIHKSYKEEVIKLFEKFGYRIDIHDFNDGVSIALLNHDFIVTSTMFWYKALNVLLENEYEFTESVKSRYEWYKSQIEKPQEPIQEVEKPIEDKPNTILWCSENGCETTLTACKKCRFTKRGITCNPKKVVIEEKDGKQYVRILK